jgi:enoyl-CoA hydratase/carnithine racemase
MPLKCERGSDWTELVLDQPPRNLLDAAMLAALNETVAELAGGDAPPLLLRSAGKHFSTGYAIDAIPESIFHRDPSVRAADSFHRIMEALAGYPSPVVAAVQGDAYGGAVELLCCTDLRVGHAGLRLGVPAVRLGLIYSHTGLRRLQRCLGPSLAREMLLTGEPVGAERAERAGFFQRLVPPDRLLAEARSLMSSVAAGAPLALRGTRRVLNLLDLTETLPLGDLEEVARLGHEAWRSEDFREAQAAFLEKRRPRFRKR